MQSGKMRAVCKSRRGGLIHASGLNGSYSTKVKGKLTLNDSIGTIPCEGAHAVRLISSFLRIAAVVMAMHFATPAMGAEPVSESAPPGERITGRLLDQEGKPLADVLVCLVSGRWLDVNNGLLPPAKDSKELRAWPQGQSGFWFVPTDADGRFSFPRPKRKYVLTVSVDAGYVISKSSLMNLPITLRLTPWSKLEGVVQAGEVTAPAGVVVQGNFHDDSYNDNIGPYLHFQTTTGKDGRFAFDHAFAGEYSLFRLNATRDSQGASVEVTVPVGNVAHATVPVVGPTANGRVEAPEALRGRNDLYIELGTPETPTKLQNVTLPPNILQMPPAEREAKIAELRKSGDGERMLAEHIAQRRARMVNAHPDGSFQILDATPGDTILPLGFYARNKQGRIDHAHRLALASYALRIPAGAGNTFDAVVDLGTLAPQPYLTTDAGQAAPDFVFQTPDGMDMALSQFKGKVILLDFWGTWCGACREELPKIKAIFEAYGANPGFAMISLSVDDEPAKLKDFVGKEGMTWTQAMLGDRKKAWPVELYQVTGYPTFWLIGSDGKTLAHGNWADDLGAIVAKALGE